MKTTKGGKVMNPTDAYRKELRKKELKRNKKERKKVREVGILKKDPDTLKDQIEKLEMMKADGALDKARKHKKRQLEDTLSLVMKKRKEYEEKMREKGEAPVMFSHLGPPPRRRTTAEEEDRVKHPKPEDSVYFHPTLNPTGAPPPGKPPMYKSSIGPRIPLSESDGGASSSNMESEEGCLSVLPPPPPPPPLPAASNESSVLPPLPPLPPAGDSSTKEPLTAHRTMPPPPLPPIQRPSQPAPPGTENNKVEPDPDRATTTMLPPPPPPPGLPPKSANHVAEAGSSEDTSRMMPLLLPPLLHRPPPSLQSDMMAVGITRFPPPPPPPLDMRPPLMVPGLSSRPPPPPPPGVFAQGIPRPPFAGLLRPSVLVQEDDLAASLQLPVPQKPSYVKSAASTVVKRPLAQHNPELTSMVPASVRVRRETAAPKGKPKAQPTVAAVAASRPASAAGRSETAKGPSIDESYMAFLEDMKSLGALEN